MKTTTTELTESQRNKQKASELEQLITLFRNDIRLFAKQIFGTDLREKQLEFANAVRDNKAVTMRGGVGYGKTHITAILVWWCLICHNRVKVSIFGPSEPNIKATIWNEIDILYQRMHPVFKQAFSMNAKSAYRNSAESDCFAEYRLASKENVSAARGIHADNNFVFVDEADGLDDIIYTDALMNVLINPAENAKLVLISNPSRASGFFWQTHNDPNVSWEWTQVHGSVLDIPEITDEHFATYERRYGGKDSRQYRVMVLGEFPEDSAEGLIPRALVDIAVSQTDIIPAPTEPYVWGLDPAGDGQDRSVLCIRQGRMVHKFEEFNNLDSVQLAYKVRDIYQATPANQRPAVIAVDSIGVGYGVYSTLKEFGLPVKDIKVSNKPTRQPERYRNLRDQIWWETKEWFATEDVQIPNHETLIAELTSIQYNTDSGKICIEAKKDLKKRMKGKSPDFADALCLTFAVSATRYASKYGFSKPLTYTNLAAYE